MFLEVISTLWFKCNIFLILIIFRQHKCTFYSYGCKSSNFCRRMGQIYNQLCIEKNFLNDCDNNIQFFQEEYSMCCCPSRLDWKNSAKFAWKTRVLPTCRNSKLTKNFPDDDQKNIHPRPHRSHPRVLRYQIVIHNDVIAQVACKEAAQESSNKSVWTVLPCKNSKISGNEHEIRKFYLNKQCLRQKPNLTFFSRCNT